MRVKAVFFDYDGVTEDTPRLNYASWKHVFARLEVNINEREYYLLEGHGPSKVSAALCAAYGLDSSHIEPLTREKEAHMRTLGASTTYKEVFGLLAALKDAGVMLGLVTGASRCRIDYSLSSQLRRSFDVIVTSDDVENTKPHPEPYQKAASSIGVTPAEALVLENAPLGIQSAKAGAFFCAAITTTLAAHDLAAADIIFPDHASLCNWILTECI